MLRRSLLAVMSIFLLFGCSKGNGKDAMDIDSSVKTSTEEKQKLDFQIETIESKIIDLNDSASSEPIKGVRYEILLFSNENISPEGYSSYEFEIEPNSHLKESLGPIENISLAKTLNDGYLYSVSFETIYREYTSEELEILKKERDFHIFVTYKGARQPVEFKQSNSN